MKWIPFFARRALVLILRGLASWSLKEVIQETERRSAQAEKCYEHIGSQLTIAASRINQIGWHLSAHEGVPVPVDTGKRAVEAFERCRSAIANYILNAKLDQRTDRETFEIRTALLLAGCDPFAEAKD